MAVRERRVRMDAMPFNFTIVMFYFGFMLIIASEMCLHHMKRIGYSQTFPVLQHNFWTAWIVDVSVCLYKVLAGLELVDFSLLAFVVQCPSVAPSSLDRQYIFIRHVCVCVFVCVHGAPFTLPLLLLYNMLPLCHRWATLKTLIWHSKCSMCAKINSYKMYIFHFDA